MYQVALCEDEPIFAETQEKVCRAVLEKLNIEYTIDLFSGGAYFLRAFTGACKRYDLILLDIIMDGVNGMELAQTIRQSDEDCAIVFITSTRDFIAQGYDVNALHYLEKPLDGGKLEQLIDRDYNKRFMRHYFVFDIGGVRRKVAVGDIVCMETSQRRVEVAMKDKTAFLYNGKLTDLLAEMPGGIFTRCHKAYAVNLDNVRELDGKDAVAVTGKRIPVSRAYVKDVEKAFMERFRGGVKEHSD